MGTRTHVIVGGGLAGAKAAEELREQGFDGRVILVGAEAERPYERPPLSKDYLRGEADARPYVHEPDFYEQHGIELRTGVRAQAIEPRTREVVIADGERLRYDSLLLATGAEPRRLRIDGAELEGVRYLRDLADSETIGAALVPGTRAVIVGAGWIGAEVAASAREKGVDVTMLDMVSVPLERVLGPELGAFYRDLHAEHGVEFLPETGVERFEGDSRVRRVITADGRGLEADLVVVGIGVAPRTELAEAAGLATDNGVLADEHLRTDAAEVFAAGDVVNAQHPFYGDRLRVEHWGNALHQGPVAARNMLGRQEPFDRLPYFFSDQYDVGMEYCGYATEWDEVVFRGDRESREFIAFWLLDDRPVAAMNVNVWDVNDQLQELIRARQAVDRGALLDPDVPLTDVLEPSRSGGGLRGFIGEGVNYTREFVRARLSKGEEMPLSDLEPGHGRVINVDGQKLAVHRDDERRLHAVSAVCTHLGCEVGFNAGERTWDCPCHGSRFTVDGEVIRGPARKPLEAKAIEPSTES